MVERMALNHVVEVRILVLEPACVVKMAKASPLEGEDFAGSNPVTGTTVR